VADVLQREVPVGQERGDDALGQLRVRQLEPQRLRQRRVDLERVAETELPVDQTGLVREPLVEQLGDDHRARRRPRRRW